MGGYFDWAGRAAAVVGVLLCAIAGIARVMGKYTIVGYESEDVFMVGIAAMVLACVARLYRPSAG